MAILSQDNRLARRLRRLAAEHEQELADLVAELVRCRTENPVPPNAAAGALDQARRCLAALSRALDQLGIDHQVAPVPGSRLPWLRARIGSGARTLYWHGHYDVVPAQRPEQFEPVVRDGVVHGRGSADMKGGLAALVLAVRLLRDSGAELDGAVSLCIVPDEETGGAAGSALLARAGLLGPGGVGMLTPEPTGGRIWNACRGALTLRIMVRGRSAHVGLQHRGVNAFDGMVRVAGELARLKRKVERRRTSHPVAPPADRRSILMLGGECGGGTNFNVVPERCSFTVERRFNPEESLETERRRLLETLTRLRRRGLAIELEVLQAAGSAATAADQPLARALAASLTALGQRARFELCPGLLETRFYAAGGVPALAYGPGRLQLAHGPKESVRLRDLGDCAVVYALTAAALLAPGPAAAASNAFRRRIFTNRGSSLGASTQQAGHGRRARSGARSRPG
jgi:acetylornithine deacetylase/succinyl-diaminopimelate desuccinylase-like protein